MGLKENNGDLLRFRLTLQQALYHANRDPDLIRLRALLRRALNITDDTLRGKQHERE